jgi:hypothetical protein
VVMRSISATDLKDGTKLALPMQRKATVTDVKVGRQFVNFRTEHGPSRVGINDEVLIEVCPHSEYASGRCGEMICDNYYMKHLPYKGQREV